MTLKCIAGIVTPDEGRIYINGRVLFDSTKKINIKPQKRKIGYLFQDYALFPTFTAYQNIESGLSGSKSSKKEIVNGLIKRFNLEGLENHYPHQLSGGQQQRTALARIIASKPDVILLDEPFSALDSNLREQMHLEMNEILKEYDNSIMVTHSRDEVYKLCNETLLMDDGKAAALGKTKELFKNPRSVRAARLTGCKNISRVERLGEYEFRALDWGGIRLLAEKPIDDAICFVGIRAHDFRPVYENKEKLINVIRIKITSQIETPFERQFIFRNADDSNCQTDIWWTFHKYFDFKTPDYLQIPSESLILLEN